MENHVDRTILEDRFKGCILGAAIGDALGMPTESLTFQEELNHYFKGPVKDFQRAPYGYPCANLEAGQYTDDTQQMIILANSLIKNRGFNLEDFAKGIGEWGYKCKTEKGYNRFGGCTSIEAALDIHNGKNPKEAGIISISCGAAMRTAPIGLFYSNSDKLRDYAKEAAQVTHIHPGAVSSAIFISSLISNIINGKDSAEALRDARKEITFDLGHLIDDVEHMINEDKKSVSEIAKIIGASHSSYQTVPMAVACFLNSPEDYEQTIINGANMIPGDTDSIACIAGAISGAYNGYGKIPERFKEKIESRKELEDIALKLLLSSR